MAPLLFEQGRMRSEDVPGHIDEVAWAARSILLLIRERRLRPARLGPVAVVVPLQQSNIVVSDKPIQPGKNVLLDIITSEIQNKLIAAFGA